MNNGLKDIDYINKQKELLEKDVKELKESINNYKREYDVSRSDFEKLSKATAKDDAKMRKRSKNLREELNAINRSVEVAESNHIAVCKRYKETEEDCKIELNAIKSMVDEKESEFVAMQERLKDSENAVKEEEFKISLIKSNFEKWKVSALESVAKLKLKGKIDSIDKAGLGEILNG